MPDVTPHDWFRAKLVTLLAEADAAGFARDVAVAVITDLINGQLSAEVAPPSEDNPNQDIGEPDFMANQATGAHPSLPDEPGGSEIIHQPLAGIGRHW